MRIAPLVSLLAALVLLRAPAAHATSHEDHAPLTVLRLQLEESDIALLADGTVTRNGRPFLRRAGDELRDLAGRVVIAADAQGRLTGRLLTKHPRLAADGTIVGDGGEQQLSVEADGTVALWSDGARVPGLIHATGVVPATRRLAALLAVASLIEEMVER